MCSVLDINIVQVHYWDYNEIYTICRIIFKINVDLTEKFGNFNEMVVCKFGLNKPFKGEGVWNGE